MSQNTESPLHGFVDESPREIWSERDLATGGIDRLLSLVEPIVDRDERDESAQAA